VKLVVWSRITSGDWVVVQSHVLISNMMEVFGSTGYLVRLRKDGKIVGGMPRCTFPMRLEKCITSQRSVGKETSWYAEERQQQ
jgi:hypothetical protein